MFSVHYSRKNIDIFIFSGIKFNLRVQDANNLYIRKNNSENTTVKIINLDIIL